MKDSLAMDQDTCQKYVTALQDAKQLATMEL